MNLFNSYALSAIVPLFSPCNTPLVPATDDNASPELVLFVGYPSIGKTTFFKKHFTPKNYIHVNQDMLKTMKKCLDEVRKSVKGGKSCVVGESWYALGVPFGSELSGKTIPIETKTLENRTSNSRRSLG